MVGREDGYGQGPVERDLYSIAEARERLGGISRGLFYSLVKLGAISMTKLGRRSFVAREELNRFSQARPDR